MYSQFDSYSKNYQIKLVLVYANITDYAFTTMKQYFANSGQICTMLITS